MYSSIEDETLQKYKISDIPENLKHLFGICDLLEFRENDVQTSILSKLMEVIDTLIPIDYAYIASKKDRGFEIIEEFNDVTFPRKGRLIKDTGIVKYTLTNKISILSNNVMEDTRIPRTDIEEDSTAKIMYVPLYDSSSEVHSIVHFISYNNEYTFHHYERIHMFLKLISKTVLALNEPITTKIGRLTSARDINYKFLANMSHELKTPLNGIVGIASILTEVGDLNDKQVEYIQKMMECALQLTHRINNILDFSKMVTGAMIFHKEPCNIKSIVDDSVKMIEGRVFNKDIRINAIIDTKVSQVSCDKNRIIQILSNLLSNSSKFTDKGFIDIRVSDSRESDKIKLIFTVSDSGRGIPSDEHEKVFNMFTQSESLDSYHSSIGSGLGLFISRQIVNLMGGKINIEKSDSKGTTIKFYVLVDDVVDINAEYESSKHIFLNKKILVVDDRVEMRLQLSSILFGWGCSPDLVSSAEEAILYLRNSKVYDLAIVDICMPGMSGVELAQLIRAEYSDLKLIALSSLENSGGEVYFDHYMYKPIERLPLFNAMLDCFTKVQPDKEISTNKSCSKNKTRKSVSKRNMRILIAEDDVFNQYTIREILVNCGFLEANIRIVNDGKECFTEVKENNYDVILMDIVMPNMNGIASARIINSLFKDKETKPVIIAISASVNRSDKDTCQHTGFSGYLHKPITKEKILGVLEPLCS